MNKEMKVLMISDGRTEKLIKTITDNETLKTSLKIWLYQIKKKTGLEPCGEITEIRWSDRMTSTYGYCQRNKGRKVTFTIVISSRLKNVTEDIFVNTLVHEIVHTFRNCDNHGFLFKKRMQTIARAFPMYQWSVGRCVSEWESEEVDAVHPIKKQENKYSLTCNICGQVFYYKTKCNAVTHYTDYYCRDCFKNLWHEDYKIAEHTLTLKEL